MKKFFTKQESKVIIDLLKSKDFENNKLGMNLIITHKRYKSLLKLIVIRYFPSYISEYYNISPKYSFKQLINIYCNKIKNNSFNDFNDRRQFFKYIINFIKNRTK